MMKIEKVLLLLVMPFYWLCLCNQIFVVSGLCLDDQQSLLLQLKKQLILIEPESSSKLKLWNHNIACCNWSGVACDIEGHVIGLDLGGEAICGGFDNSSSLFSLQYLQKLNLADNDFSIYSVIPSGFNKLEKLTYLNLSHASFVGQIPMEISQLTRLVTLDISSIDYLTAEEPKLEIPNLHKFVQNLTSIRKLVLDGVSITTERQDWCNALLPLRNLQELSMSGCNLLGPLDSSLARLENLSVIVLNRNTFSSSVPKTFAKFKNLTILNLESCNLTGKFPPKIFEIETLFDIDLSNNHNLRGSFPEFLLSGSLQTISVDNTNFSGEIPHTIGNMRHLSILDLSNCQFNGLLPNSLSNLTELSYLDLSSNSFTGPVPSFGKSRRLTDLDLSHNGLSGTIPSSLFTLPLLQQIRLSFNRFSKLDEFTYVSSSMLNTLDLSNNKISGPFPKSIFQLNSLYFLDLSSNKFNGSLELENLLELKNLTSLDLSYNTLSVNVNVTIADQTLFPKIIDLKLVSCNLKAFPAGFLKNNVGLTNLDLSHNQIQGIVPNWIWKLQSLFLLNVSYNLLTNLEGPLHNLSSRLIILDLHNNQLQGPIPFFVGDASHLDYSANKFSSVIRDDIGNYLSATSFLSLSNNALHGKIPKSICKASNLQVLDVSMNNISGTIPSCLMKLMEKIGVLNLRMNNITGIIPDTFPTSCVLKTLDLQKNNLYGKIPKSLAYCSRLEVLDLAKNQITGGFPCLLKNITTLRVMVLRENKFFGPIGCPKINDTWDMLQIVDLASNKFSGELREESFTSWMAMMSNEINSEANHIQFQVLQFSPIYYEDSVTVTSKGREMELVRILTVFTSIDFSSNHFQGKLPKQLFDFKALIVLNLSNNALSGKIPSSIGNLKQLESLDLSNNSLVGEIPTEVASLNFLSFLNVSCNQLTGKIPTGTQIQSFPETSFINNKGLFGPPLTVNKGDPNNSENISPPVEECDRLACSVDWNFLSVEIGFVTGLGILIGNLLFWKKGRVWYWKLVHKILCWIFPQLYLEHVNDRGKSYLVLRWQH